MKNLFRISALILTFAASACANIPRVELETYVEASGQLHDVTNDVLDVVAPYERAVVRNTAETHGAETKATLDQFGLGDLDAKLIPEACQGRVGEGQFCYELRDAYSTISDPTLVEATRRLSNVLQRYNAILAAYAGGVSGDILAADLERMRGELDFGLSLVSAAPPSVVGTAFGTLDPILKKLGEVRDQKVLRDYLLENHELVDAAYLELARSSTELYSNVFEGTQIRSNAPGLNAAQRAALVERRHQVRTILADWTVIVDRSRQLLAELVVAMENPQGLESRLLNMGVISARGLSEAIIVSNQIKALGLPAD